MTNRLTAFSKWGVLAAFAAAVVMGCRSKAADSDSTKGASAAVAAGMPGDLDEPLSSMDGEKMLALAGRLTFIPGPADQPRNCKGTPQCDNGSVKTTAQASAVEGQQNIGPTNVGQYGTLVAQLANTQPGGGEEARYSLKPGNGHRYYLIAHRKDASWNWTLQEVTGQGPGAQLRQIDQGDWVGCGHPAQDPAAAMFKNCRDAVANGRPVTDDPISPAWVTCTDGCCTAGPSELRRSTKR